MAHRPLIVSGLAIGILAVAGVLSVTTLRQVESERPSAAEDATTDDDTPTGDAPADPSARPANSVKLDANLQPFFQLIQDRRTGPARVRLRKHLNLNPDDGQAEFLFGLSYHREKKYEQARPYFERAAQLAPHYDPIHYFRGWGLYYLGEIEAARETLEHHLTYQPAYADTHFALGLIALDEDRLDDAAALFERSIELSGNGRPRERAKAHARIADVRIREGNFEDAKTHLYTAVDLWPDHYEAFYKLYRVHTRLGDEEAAGEARQVFEATRARLYPNTRFPE
jgi:tetratricopeptide (TPR) repeat protein